MNPDVRLLRAGDASEQPSDLDRARRLFAERRARDAVAGESLALFSEPGWDLMLALFIAYEEGRSVEEAKLPDGIAIGPATAARWIDTLTRMAMVALTVRDGIRYRGLTEKGVAFMLRCLQTS